MINHKGHMNSSRILFILQVLILCFIPTINSITTVITDNHKLVYTQCPNHDSPSSSNSSLLSSLFQEFTTRSSKTKFFETIVANDNTAISGTFQCWNNLSPDECRACVSKFQALSKNECGDNVPIRIQLDGCYAHYQEGDGPETDSWPNELLHRACSKRKIKKIGFQEMKYKAFQALESGVMMSENGFYEMKYESIRVVAQCAGSLRPCDCGECVNNAGEIACEDECRYSVSGEIYLDSCFVSYDYIRDRGFGGYSDEGIYFVGFKQLPNTKTKQDS